jgi:hypothetical protein
MRSGLLVILLAACSSSATAAPAWPKPHAAEADGGESIAPRAVARTVAAAGDADDDATEASGERPAASPSSPAGAGTAERPAAAAPAAAAPDEPINGEEIVIEIED